MARIDHRRPTDAELEILQVLWERGSATVRDVFETLSERRDVGHTTVLKLMQIMTEKGILRRDEDVRPQVYSPSRPRLQTERQLVRDLADRLFAGSPGSLALQAISTKRLTQEERDRIRELLDKLEGDAS